MDRPGQVESCESSRESSPETEPVDPESDADPDPKLTNELMAFCMLMVMQDTSKIGLYDSPLMHYLAVRGVDADANVLQSAFTYTPILGRVLWIVRLIMLEIAVPLEAWPALGLKSRADIESIPNRIHELRQQHLCEGSYSPASSILSQLAKGKHYNQMHQSPANIHWSADEQTIFYKSEPVELSKVHMMCRVITGELKELVQELAFNQPMTTIDLSRIADSMAWSGEFRQLGYSFIDHVKNQVQTNVGRYKYLFERAAQKKKKTRDSKTEWKLFKKVPSGEYVWNDSQKRSYLNRERQFLRKLMVIMQVTGK